MMSQPETQPRAVHGVQRAASRGSSWSAAQTPPRPAAPVGGVSRAPRGANRRRLSRAHRARKHRRLGRQRQASDTGRVGCFVMQHSVTGVNLSYRPGVRHGIPAYGTSIIPPSESPPSITPPTASRRFLPDDFQPNSAHIRILKNRWTTIPRVEPRARWPLESRCAQPRAPFDGKPGAIVELDMSHVAGRKHLPIVTLRRVA